MVSAKFTLAAVAVSLSVSPSVAAGFECPTSYTLTSAGCDAWCTSSDVPSEGCIYYPTAGQFPCAETSVGYCKPTSDAACSVKCLATSFFTDDGTKGKALSLGLRGEAGSFGRSEPIEVIKDLALARVTKLSIKDFLIDAASTPTHHISMLSASSSSGNASTSVLQTLELTNVQLDFAPPTTPPSLLPTTLTNLVLNNNGLSLAATQSLRQEDNATALHFPLELFSLKSLTSLDLRGNPALTASSFSSEQLAFFRGLSSFQADFSL